MKRITLLLASLAAVLLAATVYLSGDGGSHRSAADEEGSDARAVLHNAAGETIGAVKFADEDDGTHVKVAIDAPLATLAAGFHGFHVHAVGECVAPVGDTLHHLFHHVLDHVGYRRLEILSGEDEPPL